MRSLSRDIRVAARRLRATPVFFVFAVVTLALGIGVTTGIYSAVRAVFTPPSGLTGVDRLVQITRTTGGSGPMMSFSWPEYQDLISQQSTFESIAGWHFMPRASASAQGRAEAVSVELTSAGYFNALGVRAAAGRLLHAADDEPAAPPAAVVSYRMWQRWFHGAPDVVGQIVKVNATAFTIVGVADREFSGLFNGGLIPTSMWVTFSAARSMNGVETSARFDPADRGRRWIRVIGRLRPERTFAEGRTDLTTISARLNAEHPDERSTESGGRVQQVASPWVATPLGEVPKILGAGRILGPLTTALMVAVVLVLLVACTNLANLMLARMSARRQEMAVRLSLGASRWRLIRDSLAESVLLVAIGGALSIGVARVLMFLLGGELVITRGLALQLQSQLDIPVLAGAAGATLLTLIIAGLGPALHAARTDVRRAIATDNAGTASPRWRGRRYLIALQVTVSVLLVAVAALCVEQVRDHQRRDVGIDFDRLALVDVDFRAQRYPAAHVRQIVETVLRQVASVPGITAVSASSGLPAGIMTPGGGVTVENRRTSVEFVSATPDIFRTLGVAIRRGRGIDARDVEGSSPVAVVGEHTARLLFDTDEVLGRQIRFKRSSWVGDPAWSEQTFTVVGVAAAAGAETRERRPGRPSDEGVIYVPWTQHYEDRLVLTANTTGDPTDVIGVMRGVLHAAAPDATVTQSLTGSALVAQDTLFFQVVAVIATVLGGMALVVALAGLYGILSFLVAGRTREIGIRMAIGADDRAIRRQVIREGLRPVLVGLVLGFGVGAIGRLGMQPMFERMVPAMDPVVLALVPVPFIVAGLIACYLPARRASRVNPIVALRQS